jgi:hypothetical protein
MTDAGDFVTHAATCRHYVTVGPPHTIQGLEDPEHLLVDLAECMPDAQYVTLVFDVTSTRTLRLLDVHPHTAHAMCMSIVRELNAAGVRLWFAEEHAALTDSGWIDIETLDGD